MAQQLKLEVVTPERLVLQTMADEIVVPAYDGFRGIWPDHESLIAQLKLGEMTYVETGKTHSLVVGAGLLEIRENVVNVVVDKAQRPEEIDVSAMEALRKRSAEALQRGGELDYDKAQAELESSEVHLEVARRPA